MTLNLNLRTVLLPGLLMTLGLLTAPGLLILARAQTMDRIVAVIDDEVVLRSEVQDQYNYLISNGQRDDGTLYCRVLEGTLTDKLLLAKAKLDSLKVSDDQLESELNRRLEMLVRRFGSQEEFEQQLGKSILQFKVEQRPLVKDQMLVEQQRNKIFEGIDVTPQDVRDFFQNIPRDSLPYLPAEVEVSHIVLLPKPSDANKNAAKSRLAVILADIKAGKISFQDAARRYSMDPGSKDKGGFLGEIARTDVVPEFAEAVYNLNPNQISDVFESPYGYHIALLHKRVGDKVSVSHILIKPEIDAADMETARKKLLEIREKIVSHQMSFEQAAREYSQDQRTKDAGGMLTDQVTDSYRIPLDQLDPDLYLKIDQMHEGEVSQPLDMLFQDTQLQKAYQIVFLRKRYPPHRASLETDYEKFQKAAKQAKQSEALEKWFQKAKKQVFIEIKETQCQQALENWY